MVNAKKNSLVSIIIPMYNRAGFIVATLNNIYSNLYRPLELILVDDGSTDNTITVLEEFKRTHENENFKIKIITQSNLGASHARNKGLLNAEGGYIQFMDSDDLISREKIVKQVELIKRNNADFGLCDFEMIYTSSNNRQVYYSNSKGLRKVIFNGSFCCGAPILKASLAKSIKWTASMKRNQDVDYFQKAAILSNKIVHVPESHYYYMMHREEQISDLYGKSFYPYNDRINSLIKDALFNSKIKPPWSKRVLIFISVAYLFYLNIRQYSRFFLTSLIRPFNK